MKTGNYTEEQFRRDEARRAASQSASAAPRVGTAGGVTCYSLIAMLIALWSLREPEPVVPPPCPHAPHGCCRHDLQQMGPDCNPDCNRKEHQCPGRRQEPGGSVGVRVEWRQRDGRFYVET